ncbi:TonB-dependent receptor domain-containing protein [Noviherbaspirillum sp. UKPF54]|uniref:TonB-dependent receptor domain-containing protein n=1 Tax=Noviherbaspirillum sp. UKPF54 TaxID=2601898 RepID=UPI001FEE3C7E|nr:TonB-dependent receptor [Noviherbaspirillum sp. UKPF54]
MPKAFFENTIMTFFTSRPVNAAWTPIALVSALTVAPVYAQTDSEKTLAPVVVTASRTEQLQTEALPHTTVLTAQEIRNSQAVDLPALLKREAGVQITQNGGPGQASGMFVRGAETRQTLVLIDGVPLTKQDATGTVSIEHLMLDQIDRIEIVRGNVSSIYGSGAIGGVIQVFTKRGEGAPSLNVNAEAGSRGTTRVSAGVNGSSGATRYSLAASDFRTDGFSALNHDQIASANPDKDGYRNTSVSGMVSQEWSKGQELGLRFSSAEGKFDFDSSFGAPTDVHFGKTNVDTFTLFTQNRFASNWSSRVMYSESRDKNANHYDTAFGVSDDRFVSKTRSLQWNNEITLSPTWTATAGAERQWQALDSDDGFGTVFATNRNANSIFAGLQGRLDAHQWQVNVRHDQTDKVDSATTGYLGYGFNFTKAFKATASLSSGFSVPPLGYLYSPFFGNPNLKPEHSRSAELGLQYATSAALLRATLFKTRVTDQLQYDLVANRFENVARASNEGLELSASGTCLDTDLRASLTLQDPRDDTTGQRSRRRARTLASLSANKTFGHWQVGGDLGYTGVRQDGTRELGAYWIGNLTSRYEIKKGLSLFGRIENLFDRDYQTAYGYNQPPRGVFVGVNWQPL